MRILIKLTILLYHEYIILSVFLYFYSYTNFLRVESNNAQCKNILKNILEKSMYI